MATLPSTEGQKLALGALETQQQKKPKKLDILTTICLVFCLDFQFFDRLWDAIIIHVLTIKGLIHDWACLKYKCGALVR